MTHQFDIWHAWFITSAQRRSLLPSETPRSSATVLWRKCPRTIIPWCIRRGGLPLDSELSKKSLELAVEFAPAVRTFDANLDTVRSYVVIDYVSQHLRGVTLS